MKRIFLYLIAAFVCSIASAQQPSAKKILDRTSAVVSNNSGSSARFTFKNPQTGTFSGTIWLKGRKYKTDVQDYIVWYNGTTQWTYQKSADEVTISTPTASQKAQMNPYTFLSLYKKGYNLSAKTEGNTYEVHLVAQNKKAAIGEVYVTVNKTNYRPTLIKMKQKGVWTTISISQFKHVSLSDGKFEFNKKDYPNAEIIDLR